MNSKWLKQSKAYQNNHSVYSKFNTAEWKGMKQRRQKAESNLVRSENIY